MLKFPTLRRGLKLEIWLCSAICPLRGFQEFRVHTIRVPIRFPCKVPMTRGCACGRKDSQAFRGLGFADL